MIFKNADPKYFPPSVEQQLQTHAYTLRSKCNTELTNPLKNLRWTSMLHTRTHARTHARTHTRAHTHTHTHTHTLVLLPVGLV